MLGYIAGVVFRGVLGGDSSDCTNDQPQNKLLSVECVSPQQSLSQRYIGTLLIHRFFLEPQLAANDSFTCQ